MNRGKGCFDVISSHPQRVSHERYKYSMVLVGIKKVEVRGGVNDVFTESW